MRCLVVGGTGFLGGAIADVLVANDHSVSILTRGKKSKRVDPKVVSIQADRRNAHAALAGLKFDWVFDSCAYSPADIDALLNAVGDNLKRYVFVSSISAYGSFEQPNLDEETQVPTACQADFDRADSLKPEERSSAFSYAESYGPLKRACELAAEVRLKDRVTSLRVGLLVGAGDYTDRLTWWVRRIDTAHGSSQTVPAPAPQDRPIQMIDVCDVADFAVHCAAEKLGGVWNVTGQPTGFSTLLNEIAASCGASPSYQWISESAIKAADIQPWSEIPLMAPNIDAFKHFLQVSTQKAEAAGLRCRPLAETLAPLVEWDRSRRDVSLKAGMTSEQESQLLEASESGRL